MMMSKSQELDGWKFEIREVSAGVYTVDARHLSGATFYLKGTGTDGGESFLRAYATAVAKGTFLSTLHNLDNWRVCICEMTVSVYQVDATHQLGPKISFKATSIDDVVSQLHSYASELEKAIEIKRRQA